MRSKELAHVATNLDTTVVTERGAYTAARAAALSGVPKSTVHYWAREGILRPSVSLERVMLWSYGDLLSLRTIYWLRQAKDTDEEGPRVPRTSMPAVRRALSFLRDELDLGLWADDGAPNLAVDRGGKVVILPRGATPMTDSGQHQLSPADVLNVLEPFATTDASGPDLRMPRPRLRIIPGKLAGSPHIVQTRIETIALAALRNRGLETAKIYALYPTAASSAIDEALDLERQLEQNLAIAA